MAWLPIRYREFYDIPRAFVVEAGGSLYLFECPFDESLDDYPEHYRVYRLDPALSAGLSSGSWEGLASRGRLLGEVPTRRVTFDATRRAAVDDSVLAAL